MCLRHIACPAARDMFVTLGSENLTFTSGGSLFYLLKKYRLGTDTWCTICFLTRNCLGQPALSPGRTNQQVVLQVQCRGGRSFLAEQDDRTAYRFICATRSTGGGGPLSDICGPRSQTSHVFGWIQLKIRRFTDCVAFNCERRFIDHMAFNCERRFIDRVAFNCERRLIDRVAIYRSRGMQCSCSDLWSLVFYCISLTTMA